MRTREKAKGRRGGEREHFARLPESVLQHEALATAPHYALRALAALVCGYSEQQNGSMMLTGSYAAKFGLTSHDTLTKSLRVLEERGLIETTRRVSRRMKIATLFAVTWWEIHYRDGVKLDRPEPASHRYRSFVHPAPRDEECADPGFRSSRPTGRLIPPGGIESAAHHPESTPFRPDHHPAPRGDSKNLGGGERGAPRRTRASPTAIRKLLASMPGATDTEIARILGCESSRVNEVRIAPSDARSEALDAEAGFLQRATV
ncbi:MAG: hypothetical protein WD944_06470 [Steroidobacteraceae bacterium]